MIPKAFFDKQFTGQRVTVVSKDSAGRPLAVRVERSGASAKVVNGYAYWLELGQKLGWDKVPGSRYSVRELPSGDMLLVSTGAGHGVGMCQWGANEMARQGKTYKQILEFYFPDTSITKVR